MTQGSAKRTIDREVRVRVQLGWVCRLEESLKVCAFWSLDIACLRFLNLAFGNECKNADELRKSLACLIRETKAMSPVVQAVLDASFQENVTVCLLMESLKILLWVKVNLSLL